MRWARWRAASAVAFFAAGGCELVAGLGDRVEAVECLVEAPTEGSVRAGNLAPGLGPVAFCLSASGEDPIRVPRGLPGCPAALDYRELAAPANVAPGRYDVTVVPQGADCAVAPLAGTPGLELGGGAGTTLLVLGGRDHPLTVAAYPESPPPAASFRFRFIHAAEGVAALDVGATANAGLPAELGLLHFADIPWAGSSKDCVATGAADENGYLVPGPGLSAAYFVGSAERGETDALLATKVEAGGQLTLTLYAIGAADDPLTPIEPLLCNEQQVVGGLTACASGPADPVTVETLAVSLGALIFEHEEEREPAIEDALAADDADVLCLQEVWPDDNRDRIAAALAEAYPYQVRFDYDDDTPFDDPTDLDGNVPVRPTEPPCTDADLAALDTLLACLTEKCDQDGDGTLGDVACATSACLAEFGSLLDQSPRCATCTLLFGGSGTLAETRDTCTTIDDPFLFGGQSGILLLSKRELTAAHGYVAPSSWFRREISAARMTQENGVPLDIYCLYTAPLTAAVYTGVYGGGETDIDGWLAEHELFFQKLVAFVEARSGKGKAVVLGSFGIGPAVHAPDGSVINQAVEPERWEALIGELPPAAPPGWVPVCTFCGENALVPDNGGSAIDHVLGRHLRPTEPLALVRVFDANVVPAGDIMVSLSHHYGMRARLDVRP